MKFGTGTGSTPTLMGFGADPDKLVVITDGADRMKLVSSGATILRPASPGGPARSPIASPVRSRRCRALPGAGVHPAAEGWVKLGPAADLPVDEISVAAPADGGRPVEVIVVNLGQRLSAYRNECAHQGLPLNDAVLDISNGTLTCPWHGFCFDATSGECLSAPGAQLEQLPLRIDDGEVWVRP